MYSRSMKSDIGNMYGELNALSLTNNSRLNFAGENRVSGEDGGDTGRKVLFELLNCRYASVPLNPLTHTVCVREQYSEEEVEFDTAAGVRAKGTLLVPENGGAPFPAIVAMHDHGGFYYYGKEKVVEQQNERPALSRFKEKYYGGRSWASELVKRGYVVLCIDAFYFGSRKLDPLAISDEILHSCPYKPDSTDPVSDSYIDGYNKMCSTMEAHVVKHILVSGTTWPAILLNDDARSVDYLCSRKEVDKTRIGCCGLSLGGFRSAVLAASDPRIACAVVTGWMTTYESMFREGLRNHSYMVCIPGLTGTVDFPQVISAAAPRPLLVQQCSRDELFSIEGMAKACEIIDGVYSGINGESKYKYMFYDNGHQFNIKMQEDAFGWFDRWFARG